MLEDVIARHSLRECGHLLKKSRAFFSCPRFVWVKNALLDLSPLFLAAYCFWSACGVALIASSMTPRASSSTPLTCVGDYLKDAYCFEDACGVALIPSSLPPHYLLNDSSRPRIPSSHSWVGGGKGGGLPKACLSVWNCFGKFLWTINRSLIAQCSRSLLELRHHIRLVMLDAIESSHMGVLRHGWLS